VCPTTGARARHDALDEGGQLGGGLDGAVWSRSTMARRDATA
jgi:hypothetical protein